MPDENLYERGSGANPAVDEAAWLILGPALRGEPSPILETEPTWTAEAARTLRDLITGDNADEGPRKFLSKLQDQLVAAPNTVIALAAELLCVQVLPLSNITPETKRTRVNTVLSWANPPLHLPATIDSALGAGGTFHGGAGFNIRIWQQVVWLTQFIDEWWASSFEERQRALRDPWAFRDLADRVQGGWEPAMRTSLLSLVWPGYFDSVVKEADRQRIRAAFTHHLGPSGSADDGDLDHDLWRIREAVQEPGQPRVDWYAEPYLSAWSGLGVPRKHAEGRRAWLVRTGQGGAQLADAWRDDEFVSLPATNLRLELETATEASIRGAVDAGYTHLDYAQRLQLTQADQAFILRMAPDDIVLTLVADNAQIGYVSGDPSWSDTEGSRLRRTVEWFPELVAKAELPEPVPGMLDKQGDVVELTAGLDALTALVERLTDRPVDDDVVEPDDDTARIPTSVSLPSATDDLAASLHMPREVLQEWLDVLGDRRQLVFYGPPGTGKTFVAEALGRHIVGSDTNHLRTVQFHPSYAYEDFFEGLRPTVEDGNVTYQVVPGPLRNLVAEATTPGNESRPYVLVIDEMNRANLAKVFGELYYLLEYRDQSISLQYSSDSDFRLPKNLFIIGTMNTLDRSISMVDAAIRRRFPFVELHPSVDPVSGVLRAYLAAQGADDRRAALLDALNAGIDERDLQIGPSYLMKHSARDHSGLERIWKYDILPLLDDHFYGARTAEQIRAQFGLDALLAKVNGTVVGRVDAVVQSNVVVSVDEAVRNEDSIES
jgi:5-methylcytosine-specific restriction protein B